jgi:hypothetical protein
MALRLHVGMLQSDYGFRSIDTSYILQVLDRELTAKGLPRYRLPEESSMAIWSAQIPGIDGLDKLARFAAFHGLNRAQLVFDSEEDSLDVYEDACIDDPSLPFSHLIVAGGAGCVFVPVGFDQVIISSNGPPCGSSIVLGNECRELVDLLLIPSALVQKSVGGEAPDYEDLAILQPAETVDAAFECLALISACSKSTNTGEPLFIVWDCEQWDGLREISDENAATLGFSEFSDISVVDGGSAVFFTYHSGAKYVVPASFLVTWFAHLENADCLNLSDARLSEDRSEARVHFSDGSACDAAWDLVLMACEKRYEHYGGFTEKSKTRSAQFFLKHGPFRVSPQAGI